MKELTIEQKAKAYDEAYKKVAVRFGSNVADEIFLRESEDERIRKALKEYFINSFQINGVATILGVHIKDILIWLEKQGEQKSIIIPKFRVGDEVEAANEEPLTITKIDAEGYWSEDLFICGFGDRKWELVEQKPVEWSEEDRAMLDCVTSILCHDDKYEENERQIEWLKKIKDKAFPHLRLEWSSEDDEHMRSIISTIEYCRREVKNAPACVEAYNADLDWLKSLRPQSHWKPSEEQMLAISTAINVLGKGTLNGKQLIELQEQLKKLKG